MNIEYDLQADALYLTLQPKIQVSKTKELEEGILVDLDKNKKVVGLEVLEVSKKFDLKQILNFNVKGIQQLQTA